MPGRAGRGGRGQALYEALKAKSGALRRPGEESSEPTPSTSAGPEPVASQAPPGAPVPVGRGALLAKLAAQRATQEASPPGLPSSGTRPTTSTPALPIGRGMAAVQSLSRLVVT